jgi:hypothetical protein
VKDQALKKGGGPGEIESVRDPLVQGYLDVDEISSARGSIRSPRFSLEEPSHDHKEAGRSPLVQVVERGVQPDAAEIREEGEVYNGSVFNMNWALC